MQTNTIRFHIHYVTKLIFILAAIIINYVKSIFTALLCDCLLDTKNPLKNPRDESENNGTARGEIAQTPARSAKRVVRLDLTKKKDLHQVKFHFFCGNDDPCALSSFN